MDNLVPILVPRADLVQKSVLTSRDVLVERSALAFLDGFAHVHLLWGHKDDHVQRHVLGVTYERVGPTSGHPMTV